ncbi:hypothetical protein JRO89_XS15G0178900 [Xanthoceras sorbifolium]|uniref:Uncharacterized protein n=1 Tax=Xanthoceras sorbifolium TaxID=99658 RepID=A0ABQ8H2T1_9ROSI|nr:hypothetical protein JRO89_XS15G0178900 [Xanthoceras sorbifolium]
MYFNLRDDVTSNNMKDALELGRFGVPKNALKLSLILLLHRFLYGSDDHDLLPDSVLRLDVVHEQLEPSDIEVTSRTTRVSWMSWIYSLRMQLSQVYAPIAPPSRQDTTAVEYTHPSPPPPPSETSLMPLEQKLMAIDARLQTVKISEILRVLASLHGTSSGARVGFIMTDRLLDDVSHDDTMFPYGGHVSLTPCTLTPPLLGSQLVADDDIVHHTPQTIAEQTGVDVNTSCVRPKCRLRRTALIAGETSALHKEGPNVPRRRQKHKEGPNDPFQEKKLRNDD